MMETNKIGAIERESLQHYIRGMNDEHRSIILEELPYYDLFDEIYRRFRNDMDFKMDVYDLIGLPEELITEEEQRNLELLSKFDDVRKKAIQLESDNSKLINTMVQKLTESKGESK